MHQQQLASCYVEGGAGHCLQEREIRPLERGTYSPLAPSGQPGTRCRLVTYPSLERTGQGRANEAESSDAGSTSITRSLCETSTYLVEGKYATQLLRRCRQVLKMMSWRLTKCFSFMRSS